MKKILVAGDSYASETFKPIQSKSLHNKWSWSYILQSKYQVKNIACAGTSLAWTYKQLKQQDLENFDKIIVVTTASGRLTLANIKTNSGVFGFPNYATVLYRLENNPSGAFINELNWAKFYYENYYDEELDLIAYEAILNKLINLIPKDKLILIPGFYPQFNKDKFSIPFCLKDVTNKEIDWHNDFKKMHILYSETDLHVNHLSIDNKNIFANLIEDLIELNYTKITLDDFIPLNVENFNTYYEKK